MAIRSKIRWIASASVLMMTVSCNQYGSGQSSSNQPNEIVMVDKHALSEDGIIRLSKIEVYPESLDEYMGYAVEVGEISLRSEPGVLAMYAMQDKQDTCKITILEIYSSQEAYRSHIASEHFQKYKQGTISMVKSLELCDQKPLNGYSHIANYIKQ